MRTNSFNAKNQILNQRQIFILFQIQSNINYKFLTKKIKKRNKQHKFLFSITENETKFLFI